MTWSADLQELAAFAEQLADGARSVSCRYFRTSTEVDTKADDSPVTRADRETETFLRERIQARYPNAGLFGEEQGAGGLEADLVFVVDPIDGTKSFITGSPLFGTLIAALRHGKPVVGVIDMPVLKERWVGVAGQPTVYRWAERTVQCRSQGAATLAQASVSTTSPDMFTATEWSRFEAVSQRARVRRFGGDCYQYGRVACGELDLVVESDLKPYDYLALVPVVTGAGGRITDWQGAQLNLDSDGCVLATANAALHAEAVAMLGR
ncbi:histidinol-phosphatase [Rhodovibrio salinarum]|uniref:Histidinol-phosphatase n=1 Tax=Rhodovibrio salinarum TaxID=1087 RepID=A0A934QJY3_9PROT|nr:histidinol-phosphatase [Rhodovibrio salinarum]MBK1698124.1 histidinol-phosphatase [Rhodovibrio salinarum]